MFVESQKQTFRPLFVGMQPQQQDKKWAERLEWHKNTKRKLYLIVFLLNGCPTSSFPHQVFRI